ncbi:hypothetical protein Tco_0220828, partial [Tanacetum coccineum]
MKRSGFNLQQESSRQVKEEVVEVQVVIECTKKKATGRRRKKLARRRAGEKKSEESVKRQKLEDDTEKEELRVHMDIVLKEDIAIGIESLDTSYSIVDWKTQVISKNLMFYEIIRGDGSSKCYKIFSETLNDFDRQDVLELYRVVKERYKSLSPEGYDRLLWGDLITLFDSSKEDEIWK